ncbi:hypothetical protein DYB34_012661 [Aphanomyces astaci]|uniref:DDE-1 domain-containing protein n=1 Tax=Aphanomyces astaci TaxID=112090 RepID=A0A418BJZ5_APHAT|nr:hypothetical protein DYB34_012661 [Aphanomyces astaci]
MKKLKNLKLAAKLRRLTPLGAINRNVTRWSSTYSMLKRYVAIRTYIRLLGDRNILHLTPTDDQDDEIDALLLVLDELESVTLALQEVATSMLDVRNLFDECMLLHPSASKRLASNSAVVGHADFEVAITKILDQSVSSMSDGQVASVDRLKLPPKALDASQDKPLTLAQRAKKRLKVSADADSYVDCRFIRPTSNIVLDNCSSHLSVNSLPICEAYGICLVRLPANATHLLQPLDVALFGTFKRKISCGVTQCLQAMDSMTLPRDAAIKIAEEAFNTVFPAMDDPKKVNTAVAIGFHTCGIWPLLRMLCRLEAAKKNGMKGSLVDDTWLKTQEFARDMALTLPHVGWKRVLTELNWHTRDGLRASAVQYFFPL